MKALTVEATRALTKIANLQLAQIAQVKIAEIMQVSEAAISQIVASEDYKALYGEKLAEQHALSIEIDGNWDNVEAKAIGVVANHLEWMKDPEFALRAAAVANKAARRLTAGNVNNPLPAQMGQRVVINLSAVFVEKMQNVTNNAAVPALQQIEDEPTAESEIPVDRVPEKLTDSLSAKSVRMLFGNEKQTETESLSNKLDTLFGNVPLMVSNG